MTRELDRSFHYSNIVGIAKTKAKYVFFYKVLYKQKGVGKTFLFPKGIKIHLFDMDRPTP